MMTHQEIFNKVYAHLLAQNDRSLALLPDKPHPTCAYRSPDGKMCAVGCLITDEAYDAALEGKSANYLGVMQMLEKSGVIEFGEDSMEREHGDVILVKSDTALLLERLQMIHDTESVSDWPEKLAEAARDFVLEVPA